jgi:hypothetical protein
MEVEFNTQMAMGVQKPSLNRGMKREKLQVIDSVVL